MLASKTLPKSIKNRSKIYQKNSLTYDTFFYRFFTDFGRILGSKLGNIAQSWRHLGPSWRHHGAILAPSWPILDGTCRQLDSNFAHLAPILPQLREKFSPKRAKDPKKRPKSAQDPPQPPILFEFLPLCILIFIISRSFLDLQSTSEPHPDHYRNSSEIRGTVAGVAKHLDIL